MVFFPSGSKIIESLGHLMYGFIISNFDKAGTQFKFVFGSQFFGGSQNAVRRSIGLNPGSQCNTQRCPENVSPIIQFEGVIVP